MDTRLHSGAHFLVCLIACMSLIARPHLSHAIFCRKNQTAELGDLGYIHCNFTEDLHEVYWFDNVSDSSPSVAWFKPSKGAKSGPGFESGEYDVGGDGSLIITRVTRRHEGMYRVIVYKKGLLTPDTYFISLQVLASPIDVLPLIHCHNCHKSHYYSAIQGEILHCSFYPTRPPVQLEWIEQFSTGYDRVEMQQLNSTENSNGTYNSIATLHLLKDSSKFIHLLVCRATWSQSDWKREKKILLDFSSNISFSDVTPMVQYMEISKHFKIQCGQSASIYEVWKRILSNIEPEVTGFQSHFMTDTFSSTLDVEVSSEGSLIFLSPRIHHEGIYACIYGDGQKEEIQMTSVKLLIPPSPPYIQITGCDVVGYRCIIREDSTKKLTCAVYGARPNVTLEWIAEDEDEIAFFNQNEVIKERGETSDTILSLEYKVSQDVLCGEEIVIKCHLYGPLSNIMKAESKALVIPASCRENERKEEQGLDGAVIALVVLCVLILIGIAICLIIYHIHRNQTKSSRQNLYIGVPTGDSQDACLKTDTKAAGGQISNGTTFCIVKDTDVECCLKDSKEVSVLHNQEE